MSVFSDKLLILISEKHITKNKMLSDLNLGKNSFLNWEKRGNIPNGEVLRKIADYFQVDVDYLISEEHKPLVIERNLQKNVNGNNNITITSSEDEQILALLKQMDIVQRSKAIIAINDIIREDRNG